MRSKLVWSCRLQGMALPLLVGLVAMLASVPFSPCQAATPPTKIAFLRAGNVWAMDPDGGNQQQLTVDGTSLYGCTWSPDRSRLAYVSHRGYKSGYANLYVLDVGYLPDGRIYQTAGTPMVGTRLTTDPMNEMAPEWSPNSSRIAFVSDWDGYAETSTVDTNTGTIQHLTFNSVDATGSNFPTWSPDGTMIAFTHGADILIMPAAGGSSVRLWQHAGGSWVRELAWSPSTGPDSYVAFRCNGNIWVAHVVLTTSNAFVGMGETQITFTGNDSKPSWSPDGRQIAFQTVRDRKNYYRIFVMDASGANPHSISDSPRTGDVSPAWNR